MTCARSTAVELVAEKGVRPELVWVVLEGLFGTLGEDVGAALAGLSVEQVEALSREVLSWSKVEALREWLGRGGEQPGQSDAT